MTDKSEMAFKQGDEVTIVRGKLKGLTGSVLGVDAEADKYAVQTADGSFAVVNAVNVKVPDEATISASDLADALGDVSGQFTQDTLDALENRAPGITAHFRLVTVQA